MESEANQNCSLWSTERSTNNDSSISGIMEEDEEKTSSLASPQQQQQHLYEQQQQKENGLEDTSLLPPPPPESLDLYSDVMLEPNGGAALLHDPHHLQHYHMHEYPAYSVDVTGKTISATNDVYHNHPTLEFSQMLQQQQQQPQQQHLGFSSVSYGSLKLPNNISKEDNNCLQKYAVKLGLNDLGCYLATGLASLAFFFLAVILIMAFNWPASQFRHTGPMRFCSDPACLRAAATIVSKRNESVDPCDNFYKYACSSWTNRVSIPVTRSSWSTLEEAELTLRVEKSRLITTASHEPSQFNSVEWKVQHFYQSCMSLGFVESDQEKPLMKIVNSLGGWEVLRSFNIYSWDSHRVLKELHAEHGVDAFFGIDVVANPMMSQPSNLIRIRPAGLGMPDRSYYHLLQDHPAVLAYQSYMKDTAQLLGASSPEAHKFSIDIFNFEKRLAEITPGQAYLEDPLLTFNLMPVRDLRATSMNIPWLEILKATYPDVLTTEETEVVVVSPQYTADIAVIMSTTDRGSLNNYLMWRLVQAYLPFLSKSFREVVDLYRSSLSGAERPLERWDFCQQTTERFFGHLLASLYAQRQTKLRQQRSLTKKLFDYIKHNVAKSISVSSAYDYTSRRAAMNKLKNMTLHSGVPDLFMDRRYLKDMYNPLLVQKTDFFQNIQYGVMFLRKLEERSLLKPSEEGQWLNLLLAPRVSYSPAANAVVIPQVFLQPPYFHIGYPNAVNLGGLGTRLAEAVIRGVASHGLRFDPTGVLHSGNMSILATPLKAFQESARCYQNTFTADGLDTPDFLAKCRRNTALSVAALEQTLVTLDDILELEEGNILPALEDLDPQSVFFLTFAQTHCEKRTYKAREIARSAGNRLLGEEILRASLVQSKGFAHFFRCSLKEDEELCKQII